MANDSGWRGRQAPGRQPASARQTAAGRRGRQISGQPSGAAAYPEPEVRRWPHPVTGAAVVPGPPEGRAPGQLEAALYYIHCALSYQNQLLADITALLEQLVTDGPPGTPGSSDP